MLRLYNTFSKKLEEFEPLKSDFVRLYDCGPTVYMYAHIGNLWRYLVSDFLRRVLEYNGLKVKQVMNITDVGHLTEDDLAAADTGEDKIELAARKEKKTPQQIADFYTKAFFKDRERLHMLKPQLVPKASEHIEEMIKMIKILEQKGYAYQAGKKYFVYDISKFKNYGKLSGKKLEDLQVGSRLELLPEKKNPFDFALWIKDPEHLMKWDSPWGTGYPGWHIECSAMSMKYLGETLDIHTGGEDNIFPHHENEIAQSEAATGKKFVRFWLHVRHNLVDGRKMSKSKGNFYTLQDLTEKGFEPLAFRYLCLTTHYRKNLNFTWQGLEGAKKALNRLREQMDKLGKAGVGCAEFEEQFLKAINDDLNTPKALAVVWDLIKSIHPDSAKKASILKMGKVLGLGLDKQVRVTVEIPQQIKDLVAEREKLRKEEQWQEADKIRGVLMDKGWGTIDTKEGTKLEKLKKEHEDAGKI